MKAFQAFQLANALRSLGVAALASRETGPWSVRVTTPAEPRLVSDVGGGGQAGRLHRRQPQTETRPR